MAASVINLAIEQGVDVEREFTLPTGTDPSLYTFSSQIREQANPVFPVLATPTVVANSTGDPTIVWSVTAGQTLDLPASARD